MKAYKGFDKDLKCRDFQYAIGETYEEAKADLCSCGFHACEAPLDTLRYYPPAESRYCEVELDDVSDQRSYDTKCVGKKIKIGAEIGIKGLIKAHFEYVKERCESKQTGGSRSALTGGDGSALTGGYGSVLRGGVDSKMLGGMWAVLAWAIRDENADIVGVKSIVITGKTYKPGVWYTLRDGKVVKCEEDDG